MLHQMTGVAFENGDTLIGSEMTPVWDEGDAAFLIRIQKTLWIVIITKIRQLPISTSKRWYIFMHLGHCADFMQDSKL